MAFRSEPRPDPSAASIERTALYCFGVTFTSNVVFGGKSVALEEFVPNRAIVGTPDDCIRELRRIQEIANPDYLFLTPTGVPDMAQHANELRLFAREVMPLFRS